jgi:hypothetical protein
MTFINSVNAGVLVNQYDLAAYFKEVEPTAEQAMLDATVLGQSSPNYLPGLKSGGFSAKGLYESTALLGSDAALPGLLAAATTPLVAAAPKGFGTIGNRAYMLQAHLAKYSLGIKVGDLVSNMAEFRSTDGFDFGAVIHELKSESSDSSSTAHDNAAATTNGGVGFLHMTANGVASVTVKIQHSTNNSVWADLVTFTSSNVATSERIVLAAGTTVNRYLRATWSSFISPGITFAVLFARR